MSWPPAVDELVLDLRGAALPGEPPPDTSDTDRLRQVLDAAVAYVQRVKAGVVDFGDAGLGTDLPAPDADLRLGTLRLAGRWHTRRRSPDALIQMADFGASRVPSVDADIERLLRIGRYSPPVIA
ncbi:hypothetical protein AB0N38_10530 [Micromonospora aurantiaca]|uniref:hypothetical protein n=1 Tax=Micromonospora aurantiaca (nom. illeg.) TaxID=47850 RepID=UPI0034406ECD